MHRPGRFRLVLTKEDFKFSVAHFTVFGADEAEPLHGHNYRVEVELEGDTLDDQGLLADIAAVKARIRALCAELDDFILIPRDSGLVEVLEEESSTEVRYGGRVYRFPSSEVRILPLANTTMELFATWFWDHLAPELPTDRIDHLAVTVEETAGQKCRYASTVSSV